MIISRCTFLKNNNNFSLVLRSLLVKINYYEIFMLAQMDNSMKSGVKSFPKLRDHCKIPR